LTAQQIELPISIVMNSVSINAYLQYERYKEKTTQMVTPLLVICSITRLQLPGYPDPVSTFK